MHGQSQELSEIVERIAKINEVQGKSIGFSATESENYKNYRKLKELATIEDLVLLTDHKNAAVACYAGWALADSAYSDLHTVFYKFITEDRDVATASGCIRSTDKLSSELYHRYWNSVPEKDRTSNKILVALDSIIIYSKDAYWLLLDRAMENRIYQEPFKSQIVHLAFDDRIREAIFYLSNWHKAEYVEQIKAALLKYLNATDFKSTGTTDYYRTVEELFRYNDPEVRKAIIVKMKKDRHWEHSKERFKFLLAANYIYDLDRE